MRGVLRLLLIHIRLAFCKAETLYLGFAFLKTMQIRHFGILYASSVKFCNILSNTA